MGVGIGVLNGWRRIGGFSKKKESKPARKLAIYFGWAGVIFLPLLVGFPVSGFPVNTPHQQWEILNYLIISGRMLLLG